jgi:type IV pilus assembly protein PilC
MKLRDKTVLFQQFAALISAGIPIITACEMLETSLKQTATRSLITGIKRDLLTGKTLSVSLQRHPQQIDSLIHQLVHISEHTGKLDMMLQMIAQHLERRLAFREQIIRALFYPGIIAICGMMITLGMFIFIVPRFAELFQDFPGTLPPLTLAIFTLSAILRQAAWLLLLLPFPVYLPIYFKIQIPFFRLPFLKHHLRRLQLARFTRSLALTLQAGMPISAALTLAAEPCRDPLFQHTTRQVSRRIRSGMPLHRAMKPFSLYPALLIQLIQTGEESGQLDSMLAKAADMMDTDIERLLHRFSQLLEPLIMLILGVLIGGLVTGMYLPIFKLGSII